MFETIAMKRGALAVLLATTFVGAAEAQSPPTGTRRAAYCTGGLFTLSEGTAKFHLALDDNSSGPSALVLMRIIDPVGNVVRTKSVTLGPGRSATLEHSGTGLFRVQAETFESAININFSDRRNFLSSLELPVTVLDVGGDGVVRLIGPPIWVQCLKVLTQ
jgi:hypothetical protein